LSRDLSTPLLIGPPMHPNSFDDRFVRGNAWGSLFWAFRLELGPAATDEMLIAAWRSTGGDTSDRDFVSFDREFVERLISAAPLDRRGAVKRLIVERNAPR
jgi:hypothetical protein